MLVVVAIVNLALTAAFIARARSIVIRKGLRISAAIVAAVMSVATVITRPLVEWDQLARPGGQCSRVLHRCCSRSYTRGAGLRRSNLDGVTGIHRRPLRSERPTGAIT